MSMHRRICLLAIAGALVVSFTWTQASTSNAPSARYSHGMVYDSTRGVTVLFGGVAISAGNQNDTWEWNGQSWTQMQVNDTPPVHSQASSPRPSGASRYLHRRPPR